MPVQNNSFVCGICQKTFNNGIILIKHVEFRHSTGEQTAKSNIGSGPKAKDGIDNDNMDPLEIPVDNSDTPFEFVPIQENVEKYPVKNKGQTEGINDLNNGSHDGVNRNVDIADFVFEREPLQFEKGNNGKTEKAPFCTKKEVYHNEKKLQKCFVKIQKLPKTYYTLAKRMNRERDLNRHIKSVHEEKKSFKCNICATNFAAVHEGKKAFKCNNCGAAFSQKGDMNRHIESVHEGKKSFKCNVCDTAFFEKNKLNAHIKSVHKGKKPFKCNICDYTCSRKLSLKRHVETFHKGKKPFQCNKCDASFSQKVNMNGHIETVHEGKKPFKCNV
jgi:uncharacterized Zn-finger protein